MLFELSTFALVLVTVAISFGATVAGIVIGRAFAEKRTGLRPRSSRSSCW